MFERKRHAAIALLLDALDADLLSSKQCYFGGGTAMAMRFGEWRLSTDIDMIVSNWDGYRELRVAISEGGIDAISRSPITQVRDVVADQYGIRTMLDSDDGPVKFEIIHEGRIDLDRATADDAVCGVATLTVPDMVATKLLANDDRWADRSVYSRDLIDLAMLSADDDDWAAGYRKAAAAYGSTVDTKLRRATEFALADTAWLKTCIHQMDMDIAVSDLRTRIEALQGSL
ncbi:nucleotidyl transferase AbiEii/AbiGii toxin family protein [Rhodococcus sp. BS-15]|uniref:nucleotidyl transferase AbiEii/AbiGii toxin family protein n=1 Tax=Rhodococcus sp. BS-15 TaxID=1304954 RepID=UPI0016513D4A|nr:nucleotidyl transferase AbiEii/AbiGii toxin family protein [Rhodococcus sp. BS-15]